VIEKKLKQFKRRNKVQKFIGTKIIKAFEKKVTWKEHYENQKWNWPEDKKGEDRIGYTVGYSDADGNFNGEFEGGCEYITWSPADVFESSYKKCTGMSLCMAVEAAKKGLKVARDGWNGNGMWLEAQFPDKNSKMTFPYLFMNIPDCEEGQRRLPWQPAQVDLFKDDWHIVGRY
jgi:hypothetical protein